MAPFERLYASWWAFTYLVTLYTLSRLIKVNKPLIKLLPNSIQLNRAIYATKYIVIAAASFLADGEELTAIQVWEGQGGVE